jgi:predicted TIM-barrel fold metal-dependent hydrolase
MSQVIDLDLDLPPTNEDEIVGEIRFLMQHRGEKGLPNYVNIFGPGRARTLGLTLEEVGRMWDELSPQEFETALLERARGRATPLEEFISELDDAGVKWGLIGTGSNERTAEIVSQLPDRLIGEAMVDPHDGMKAVRELERAVKELGLRSFYASPFRYGIRPNDKKFYPLYAKAVELGIPMFVYCTMNYRTDFPMDLAHPVCLDEVARDFPEMTIVADCGGWPWVPEMIGVARRHQNVYIDTAAHRPKYFATPGSGWEMLMQFGNTLLQDRIVFASGWRNYQMPIGSVVEEMRALPLKEEVKEKWLYGNAARIFNLE